MKIKEKPMQFTLFYSGLVGSIQAVGFKDTKKLLGQTDDLYIDTIEYSAYAELLKQNEELREKNDHLEDKVYHSTRLVEELRLGNLELKRKLEVVNEELVEFATNQIISFAHVSGNEKLIARMLKKYGIAKILKNLQTRNKTVVISQLISTCEQALKEIGE